MKNTIKGYLLNNMEVTMDLVNQLNSWNNCLNHLEAIDMEELDLYLEGLTPTEIANKMFFGDFNPNKDYFRFNAYANLESFDAWDLEEEYKTYIDEIVEALLENMDDITIYDDELKDMLVKYRYDIDEEEEEE